MGARLAATPPFYLVTLSKSGAVSLSAPLPRYGPLYIAR